MAALSDRQVRLECMKMAAAIAMQAKCPKESIVGVARQFYAFVTETGSAPDPLEEFRRRPDEAAP